MYVCICIGVYVNAHLSGLRTSFHPQHLHICISAGVVVVVVAVVVVVRSSDLKIQFSRLMPTVVGPGFGSFHSSQFMCLDQLISSDCSQAATTVGRTFPTTSPLSHSLTNCLTFTCTKRVTKWTLSLPQLGA